MIQQVEVTHRDIRVYKHCGESKTIQYYFGCYDALQYPLICLYGNPGRHRGIPSEEEQLFTPKTVKNMTQVEGVSMQSRSDYPSPSAKRGLDFVSADIDKPNADALPTGDDTDQTVGENDSALLADSPVKNSEGKLKLS